MSSLRAAPRCSQFQFQVSTFCCGCELKSGVLLIAIFSLINACLAFAGEAALYAGLATALAARAGNGYLPPGTKIDDLQIQAGLTFVGLYLLVSCICAFVAALRRDVTAALITFVIQLLDFLIAIAVIVISFFLTGSITALLAQVPPCVSFAYITLRAGKPLITPTPPFIYPTQASLKRVLASGVT